MSEADKMSADAGACLTTIIMQGRNIAVGNVGDCRAVHVAPDGTLTQLTAEHRADDPAEEARIVAEGGRVKNGYLNGVLQPSRTIGDRDEKRATRGGLSARPFIASMQLPPPPSQQEMQASLSKTDKTDLRRQVLHLRKPPSAAAAAAKKKGGRKGGRQRSGSVSSTGASPLQMGLASAGDETPYGVLGVPDEFGLVALDDMQLTPAATPNGTNAAEGRQAAGSGSGSSGGGGGGGGGGDQAATADSTLASEGKGGVHHTGERVRAPQAASTEWDSSDNEGEADGKAPPPSSGASVEESSGQRRRRRRHKARKHGHADGQDAVASLCATAAAAAAAAGPAEAVDAATAAAIAQAYRELNGGVQAGEAGGEWTTVTAKTGASQAVAQEAARGNAVIAPPAILAEDPPPTSIHSPLSSPVPSEATSSSNKARRRRQRQRKNKGKAAAASASCALPPEGVTPPPAVAETKRPASPVQAAAASAPISKPVPAAIQVSLSPLQRAMRGFETGGPIQRGPCVAALPPAEEPDQLQAPQQEACIWQLPSLSALIVASDGVWDTLDNSEAAIIVAQALQAHSSAEEAARTLVRSARSRGSEDDITALVLWFTPGSDDEGLVTM